MHRGRVFGSHFPHRLISSRLPIYFPIQLSPRLNPCHNKAKAPAVVTFPVTPPRQKDINQDSRPHHHQRFFQSPGCALTSLLHLQGQETLILTAVELPISSALISCLCWSLLRQVWFLAALQLCLITLLSCYPPSSLVSSEETTSYFSKSIQQIFIKKNIFSAVTEDILQIYVCQHCKS